jgi:membrane-bound lytic murein transglycosylase C
MSAKRQISRLGSTAALAAGLSAAALLAACTTQQVMNVALSKDPKVALKALEKSKLETYKRDPRALMADFERVNAELNRLFGNVKQESSKKWGTEESQTLPSAKRYVKYTEQYKNRIVVNYETGNIRIEHIQEPQVADKLRRAAVVALLTPQDPRAADVFSDKDVELEGKPFLQDLVLNQNRQPMKTRADVEAFADFLVTNRLQTRRIRVGGAPVDVAYVEMDMIGADQDRTAAAQPAKPRPKKTPRPGVPTPPNMTPDLKADDRADPNQYASADRIAPKFLDMVNRHAKTSGVDPALIMAVIYQESRFNPNAVSQAEAYGMMQLVPKSGGAEAFRKAKGESAQPTKDYLMDPDNNIELGATYLGMILFDYWPKEIGNFPSREYCTISAYNTGPGNVARAFTGGVNKQAEAQEKANQMRPDQVFDYLRSNLPYAQTRDYLLRVAAARRHYKELFYPDS